MTYEVKIKHVAEMHVIRIGGRVSIGELSPFINRSNHRLYALAKEAGVNPAGRSITIYHGPVNDETDGYIDVCLPLASAIEAHGDAQIQADVLPAGDVAYTLSENDYPELLAAYDAVAIWVRESGREYAGHCRETLLSNPDKFPEETLFEIAFPIQ